MNPLLKVNEKADPRGECVARTGAAGGPSVAGVAVNIGTDGIIGPERVIGPHVNLGSGGITGPSGIIDPGGIVGPDEIIGVDLRDGRKKDPASNEIIATDLTQGNLDIMVKVKGMKPG